MNPIKLITQMQLEKEMSITERAIGKVKLAQGLSPTDAVRAKEFLDMAKRYFSDAHYFKGKGDYVRAYGATYYAHAWLDAGAMAGFFDVHDSKLFMVEPKRKRVK